MFVGRGAGSGETLVLEEVYVRYKKLATDVGDADQAFTFVAE
jgi:hypothetical protein